MAECRACLVGSCRRVRRLRPGGARYQVLRRAIRAWGPPPRPSTGLADRILAEIQTPMTRSAWADYGSVRRETPVADASGLAAIAAAAAVLAIALPALNRSIDRTQRNGHPVVLHNTPVDPDRDSATNAGDCAGAQHGPGRGDSRDVGPGSLGLRAGRPDQSRRARRGHRARPTASGHASVTGSESIATTVSVPSLDSLVPDTAAAGAMLQQVGDRLSHGVRPLSDTARHAFGFLLGTTVSKPEAPANPPAQKGA